MLRASAAHFAGIGWITGCVAALVYLLVWSAIDSLYASLIAAVLSTVATVLLTGGFHEDGLADLADGLGGSYDKARALEIMKDSRIGSFGAMTLFLALLLKVALLATLGEAGSIDVLHVVAIIWGSQTVSRALPMGLVALLPHVGADAGSKSKPLADRVSAGALLSNFLWCIAPFSVIYIASNAIVLIVSVLFCGIAWVIMLWRLRERLQGYTGDALGATQQVCELAFLLGAVVVLR